MENKVKKLIKKLEAENADRKDDLMYSSIKQEVRKAINYEYKYTCEIIRQLKNCL